MTAPTAVDDPFAGDGRPPLWLDGRSLTARTVASVARTHGPPDLHLDRAALADVERVVAAVKQVLPPKGQQQ